MTTFLQVSSNFPDDFIKDNVRKLRQLFSPKVCSGSDYFNKEIIVWVQGTVPYSTVFAKRRIFNILGIYKYLMNAICFRKSHIFP